MQASHGRRRAAPRRAAPRAHVISRAVQRCRPTTPTTTDRRQRRGRDYGVRRAAECHSIPPTSPIVYGSGARAASGAGKRKMAPPPPPAVAWGHAGDRGRTWGRDRPIDRAGSYRVQWPTGRPAASLYATVIAAVHAGGVHFAPLSGVKARVRRPPGFTGPRAARTTLP
ncbi:hypothetical protein GUJ93_ZPchr0006g45593 [Zizania palustris]|uniref:Uncharacterized protein n=1 Tax=Zizania palustris TaxID=103762 RepID=A0A8J5SGF3_ZIZPA|nr:hypothetical protein GUJ93_ZPchr0006g45593 [Zizania palustris]